MKTMMRALPVLCVAFAGLTALGGKPVMVARISSYATQINISLAQISSYVPFWAKKSKYVPQ